MEIGAYSRAHDADVVALVMPIPSRARFSFGTGFVLLMLLALALPQPRRGLRRIRAALTERRLRWWHFAGGFCGAGDKCAQEKKRAK